MEPIQWIYRKLMDTSPLNRVRRSLSASGLKAAEEMVIRRLYYLCSVHMNAN